MKSFDALILGAGPAGLTAALYLVRGGMSTALVEKGAPGGQVLSTAEIENYPGFPKGIKGWELADMFSAHLDEYPVERLRGEIVSLEIPAQEGGWFEARFAEDGESVRARSVIVCTGAHHRALARRVRTGLPGGGFPTVRYATATSIAERMWPWWAEATPRLRKPCTLRALLTRYI